LTWPGRLAKLKFSFDFGVIGVRESSVQVMSEKVPEKKENCGLFGVYGDSQAVHRAYLALHSLQHRGQESAGIASSDGRQIQVYTGMGTVRRVFRAGSNILANLANPIAIGHVRYSTTGGSKAINSQPLLSEYSRGQVAVAHNGNLINAMLLRDEYEAYGSIFKSTSDTEIITHLLAKPTHVSKPDPLTHVLNQGHSGPLRHQAPVHRPNRAGRLRRRQ